MSKVWRVLTWSPFGRLPWHFHMQNCLLTLALLAFCSGWGDKTVNFYTVETDEDHQVEELPTEAWNVPLDLGDGKCLVIETREMIDC
jgi:hypothetical protein